jgi:hypothetical protein
MAKKLSSAPAQEEPAPKPQEVPKTNGGETATAKGTPPVWKKRFYNSGSFVECAVFRHQAEPGQSFPMFSVALDRSYKDDKGEWHETHSLRRDDLLVAGHALQRAYAWITEQEQAAASAS